MVGPQQGEEGGGVTAFLQQMRTLVVAMLQSDGYKYLHSETSDYGKTVKLVVEKDGERKVFPLVEQCYDTDENGCLTEFHGEFCIWQSPWFRNKLMEKE